MIDFKPTESRPLPPCGILAGLTDQALEKLAPYGNFYQFNLGQEIITEGVSHDYLLVVVEGEMKVLALVSGETVELAQCGPGECLGEISLFEPGPASASVQVISESAMVWILDRAALYDFVEHHPGSGGGFLIGIAQSLSHRLRHANQTITASNHEPGLGSSVASMEPLRAENNKHEAGLFGIFKRKQAGEAKVKISTEIKF